VSLDQPQVVVTVDEAGDGLAELVNGVVQLSPQALLFEGADPALGAAVGLRLAQERRVVSEPSQPIEPPKWAERYWGPQSWRNDRPRAMSASSRPQRSTTAS
jgi:hypothetical protein